MSMTAIRSSSIFSRTHLPTTRAQEHKTMAVAEARDGASMLSVLIDHSVLVIGLLTAFVAFVVSGSL
jgi:hypothetical protein